MYDAASAMRSTTDGEGDRVGVRELAPAELTDAAAVLGRGMRDNPLHLRAFGEDAAAREAGLTALFDAVLARHHAERGVVLGAFLSTQLVGVCAMVQPGRCQPSLRTALALLPALAGHGGAPLMLRMAKWTTQWSRRDPETDHWHLGPVGVERHLQRRGVGTALLSDCCRRLDAMSSSAYLETDKPGNVAFYERFGFQVVGDGPVLGVPNWFMVRTP